MASKRSTRAPKEPVAAVEVIDEEGKGASFEMGIVITTTILLIGAVVLVMKALGNDYGVGPFGG